MLNPLDLSGRRIMVTGASAGIGRETAILLSRLGARIIAVGRNRERLESAISEMEGDGHVAISRDLSETDSIPAWMKEVVAGDTLWGLVHSAGIVIHRPLKILSGADIRALNAIHLDAAMMLAKGLRQKGVSNGGSIVFFSGIIALRGKPSLAPYAAAKGALIALARTLALELAREGIRVNCVCPGLVKTQMADDLSSIITPEAYREIEAAYPLGLGLPGDVANATAFLLSDAARWITGSSLVVDGGYTA